VPRVFRVFKVSGKVEVRAEFKKYNIIER